MERPSAAHGADVGALGLTMAASSAAMCLMLLPGYRDAERAHQLSLVRHAGPCSRGCVGKRRGEGGVVGAALHRSRERFSVIVRHVDLLGRFVGQPMPAHGRRGDERGGHTRAGGRVQRHDAA